MDSSRSVLRSPCVPFSPFLGHSPHLLHLPPEILLPVPAPFPSQEHQFPQIRRSVREPRAGSDVPHSVPFHSSAQADPGRRAALARSTAREGKGLARQAQLSEEGVSRAGEVLAGIEGGREQR